MWDGWQQVGAQPPGASEPAVTYAAGPTGILGHRKAGSGYVRMSPDYQGSADDEVFDDPLMDPYGQLVAGARDIPLSFQGHEWRDEAGLYYMRNRWMDPATGRFLSRDPIVNDAGAVYTFAAANPVLMADPLGLIVRVLDRHGSMVYGSDSYSEHGAAVRIADAIYRLRQDPTFARMHDDLDSLEGNFDLRAEDGNTCSGGATQVSPASWSNPAFLSQLRGLGMKEVMTDIAHSSDWKFAARASAQACADVRRVPPDRLQYLVAHELRHMWLGAMLGRDIYYATGGSHGEVPTPAHARAVSDWASARAAAVLP